MSLAGIDLNLLVVLDALFDEKSVTRAAKRVGLTQPALSNALARLRAQLGDPLFVRSGQGIVPTARAQEIEPALKQALRTIDAALAGAAFDASTSRRVFRVMTTDYMESALFPPLLARLKKEAPFVDLEVKPAPANTSLPRDALERGEVEVTLGLPVDEGAGIVGAALFSERYVGLARKAHPLFAHKLTAELWASLPHVLVAPRGSRVGAVDTALAELGLARRIHVLTPHFATAPRLLVDSDLVLTLFERAARMYAAAFGLKTFTPPVTLPTVAFGVRWHERNARDPGHRWFRRLVVDVAKRI